MANIILTDDPSPRADYDDAQPVAHPSGHILLDGVQVADTVQCVHCNRHFVMRRGSGKVRGWCQRCHGVICGPGCHECVPFERKLDLAELRGKR